MAFLFVIPDWFSIVAALFDDIIRP